MRNNDKNNSILPSLSKQALESTIHTQVLHKGYSKKLETERMNVDDLLNELEDLGLSSSSNPTKPSATNSYSSKPPAVSNTSSSAYSSNSIPTYSVPSYTTSSSTTKKNESSTFKVFPHRKNREYYTFYLCIHDENGSSSRSDSIRFRVSFAISRMEGISMIC